MRVDMRPILSGETDDISIDYSYALPGECIPAGVEFTGETAVSGHVHDDGGYISLRLSARVPYRSECARCLCEVDGVYTVTLEKGVAEVGKLENEDTDDYVFIENSTLELDEVISEQIILDFPSKLLCREDCKGLCEKCGKNLNEGDCGCVKKEPDPRLAVLAKLLSANKDGADE